MAIDAYASFGYTNGVTFPDCAAVNSSGALSTDGTEFNKLMIDNYMFGRQQALLAHVGITPNGSSEANGASQEILALQRMGMYPGQLTFSLWNDTPINLGIRVIMLQGQGIVRANYPDLDAAIYCGDGNNATAESCYHADNSDGSSRNTAGAYLILPDARGIGIRGFGTNGKILKANGGSYIGATELGKLQTDQMQGHWHPAKNATNGSGNSYASASGGSAVAFSNAATIGTTHGALGVGDAIADASGNSTPRTGDETRMATMTVNIGVIY